MLDRDKVDIEVTEAEPYVNKRFRGLRFEWEGNIGFGEYTLYQNTADNKWYADSECMDTTDDKWFLKKLLEDFISRIEVTR